ncbi:PREDICTED: PXMP2/4 family protein 2 isoform X2 [Tarenaya hassleriana]|uniref:PXMP2/4 family protein 2 isoform X2 n=1 Tax=Tarenaya hassleriana TaxID=28532 RepID=UPI00053C9E66|nr:PREDICTED: PXMP2/4 family protein 2 isoform X2 [Tarenaya hassleriana]
MLKLWRWYQRCLAVHPVKTQVISSGFLWGIGDITAQYITHSTAQRRLHRIPNADKDTDADAEFKVNWKRVAITSMFGFGFVGPIGHFWYEGLDRFIKLRLLYEPKTARFVAAKVAMDGLIFGPFDLLVFFTYMGFATGKNPTEVKEGLKRDFLPALVLEGGAWPLLQIANFRYVPVRYQLLYVNIFCLLDSAFLSWVEQQKDAAWKQWFTSSFETLKDRGGQRGV